MCTFPIRILLRKVLYVNRNKSMYCQMKYVNVYFAQLYKYRVVSEAEKRKIAKG